MSNGLDIPVTWIYEQIKEHPGMHAASWKYLLDLWDAHLLEARYSQQPVENDEYVRLQQDMTAAEKILSASRERRERRGCQNAQRHDNGTKILEG